MRESKIRSNLTKLTGAEFVVNTIQPPLMAMTYSSSLKHPSYI